MHFGREQYQDDAQRYTQKKPKDLHLIGLEGGRVANRIMKRGQNEADHWLHAQAEISYPTREKEKVSFNSGEMEKFEGKNAASREIRHLVRQGK